MGGDDGGEEEIDLPTVCAGYVVPEGQVWEETGMVPNKIPAVPEDLLILEFNSGTNVIHEDRLLTTDRVNNL